MRAALTVLAVFALVAAAAVAVVRSDPAASLDAAMNRAFDLAIEQAETELAARPGRAAPGRAEAHAAAAPSPAKAAPAPSAFRSLAELFTDDDAKAARSGKKVYYQYADDAGNVHFVATWEQVPGAYRKRAGRIEMGGREPTSRRSAQARAARRAAKTPSRRPFAYSPDPEVVVYSAPWCGWCRKTLAHLDRKGVRYVNKDIEAQKANRDELVRKTGRSSIPVVEIDGQLVRGHDPARLDQLLAQAG